MADTHEITRGVRLEVASHTDRGKEREENQDTPLVAALPRAVVVGVCDGMCGAAGGQLASQSAVAAIDRYVRAAAPSAREALARALFDSLGDATRRIYAIAKADPRLDGMGTTATIAGVADDLLIVAQIGDSRAYLFRNGALTQLTRDQTLAQALLEKGQLAPEELASFPHANVILQAVGTSEHLDVDLKSVQVCRGDVLLVCSDGLHGPVAHAAIAATLANESSLDAACAALVLCALEAGGPDNVTCVLARFDGDGLAPPTDAVAVTPYVLAPIEPDPVRHDAEVPVKTPLSHLWPLRWGPWASKKTP